MVNSGFSGYVSYRGQKGLSQTVLVDFTTTTNNSILPLVFV